jgi:hypothetical protein
MRPPLPELCVLAGLVLTVVGFVGAGRQGPSLAACGFALASLGGLEGLVREHAAGLRSRAALVAGAGGAGLIVAAAVAVALWS